MGVMKTIATMRQWNPRIENLPSSEWWLRDVWKAQARPEKVAEPRLSLEEINWMFDEASLEG